MADLAFPLVDVTGPPFERGRQYGEQAAGRVRRGADAYRARLGQMKVRAGDLEDLVRLFLPRIAAFDAAYVEEMRGIAEGAGLPFEDVALVNARTEILATARRDAARAEHAGDGCTGVVVLPEASVSGRLVHAQNWDWMAECAHTAVILRVRPEKGPAFLTFTEAGGLARSGFNASGVAITANYLESDRDFGRDGVPLPLIRRKALEQEHMALAMRVVATTPKSASNNMILSHRDGFAVSIECAPDEAFNIYPERGLIVHANHWQSPVALCKLKERAADSWSDSFYRDWRVRRLLERDAPLSIDDVKAALDDRAFSPYSVCRPERPSAHGYISATVASLVIDAAEGWMEIAPLPASGPRYTRYPIAAAP